MKDVRVRFFAVFRDATGVDSLDYRSSAGSVKELFDEMTRRYAGLQSEAAALVAINDELTSWDQAFDDGDEVLFFPPVAGG